MKLKTFLLSAGALGLLPAAHADFVNLDFEQAQLPNPAPGFLSWAQAAPGWQHSDGSDTSIVYHQFTHVGQTQWYLLVSANSYASGLLGGNYSMAFASGNSQGGPGGVWTPAFLSQQGLVPSGSNSLRLSATGPFEVYVGGTLIPMFSLGNNVFEGNVTAFAGLQTELKIVNVATQLHTPVALDNITFSPALPVPEPATLALMPLGLFGLLALARRRLKLSRP